MRTLKPFRIVVKAVALTLVSIILCTSLSGCFMIDFFREYQGFFTEDGRIEYDGKLYRLLPDSQSISVYFSNYETVFITEPDVPALLSQDYGTAFKLSEDRVFLEEYDSFYKDGLYCEETRYNEYAEKISAGIVLDCYGLINDSKVRILTEKETAMINSTVSDDGFRAYEDLPLSYGMDIYACTPDGFFIKEAYRILEYEDDFYIGKKSYYSDDMYTWELYQLSKVDYSMAKDILYS